MKVSFKPSAEFIDLANKIYREEKDKILKLIPNVDVQHIGSTAIPGSMTKGDLDLVIRVDGKDFKQAVKALKSLYEINQPENWTETFASFNDDKSFELPFGAQLMVKGSDYDDFDKLRDLLIRDPELLKEYNKMKLGFEGKDMDEYRKAKSDFFEKMRKNLK